MWSLLCCIVHSLVGNLQIVLPSRPAAVFRPTRESGPDRSATAAPPSGHERGWPTVPTLSVPDAAARAVTVYAGWTGHLVRPTPTNGECLGGKEGKRNMGAYAMKRVDAGAHLLKTLGVLSLRYAQTIEPATVWTAVSSSIA